MKILNAKQTHQADAYSIKAEAIHSIDLMERASTKFVEIFYQQHDPKDKVAIICGNGNNGGDGLAISRILLSKGYTVQPYVIQKKIGGSDNFLTNLKRLEAISEVNYIKDEKDIPDLKKEKIIIDAIFGSGLTRNVTGLYENIIHAINASSANIVAVDMPSGLFVDTQTDSDVIVHAQTTISFQNPKLSFFMPESFKYVGNWIIVDIGLDQDFINNLQTNYSTIDSSEIDDLLPQRNKFDHKGTFGHGQLIGGSHGKMGAIILAAKAFLRTGAGLLTVTIPSLGNEIIQNSVPEAMVLPQPGEKYIRNFNVLTNTQTIGIGPGLDQNKETVNAFRSFLRNNNKALILDADALNIISKHQELLPLLPEGTIITPHIKEFDRLVGPSHNHWQRIEKATAFAKKWHLAIVLKGAHTAIINHDGTIKFNTTGNPGMATGGSGDVLLGIIASLRTQKLSAFNAAITGTFIHGQAGDIAAARKSMTSLLAGDIINSLPDVFLQFKR